MSGDALKWLRKWPDAEEIRNPIQWTMMQEIAFHFDEARGYAYPKIEDLARRTRYGERAVRRALDVLDACGYIDRRQRRGSRTHYTLPSYRDDSIGNSGRSDRTSSMDADAKEGLSDRTSGATPPSDSGRSDLSQRSEEPQSAVAETAEGGLRDLHIGEQDNYKTTQDLVKAASGPKQVLHPDEPISPNQLAMLRDIYLLQTAFEPPAEHLEGLRSLTKGEADDEIKREWALLEDNGPAYIPASVKPLLSAEAGAWLDRRRAEGRAG